MASSKTSKRRLPSCLARTIAASTSRIGSAGELPDVVDNAEPDRHVDLVAVERDGHRHGPHLAADDLHGPVRFGL